LLLFVTKRHEEEEEKEGEVYLFCDSFWQAASLSTHTVPVQTGANKSPEPLPPYSQLIDQLAKAVTPIYERAIMACPSIDEMVRPALLSNCVSFGRSPHKGLGAPTYSSYIASGLYINSKDDIEGTPVLSPLTLRVILRTNPRWTLAKSIRMLLDMDNVRWPDGFAYERFHARWECLWRELHRMHGKYVFSLCFVPSRSVVQLNVLLPCLTFLPW